MPPIKSKTSASAFSFPDQVAFVWFVLDAFTHLTIEAAYVYVTMAYGGAKFAPKGSFAAIPWIEYGRADARWAAYDPTTLSIELITVVGAGAGALGMIYAMYTRAAWRHVLQLVLCTAELYGGWLTFAPEWLARPANPNLTNDPWMVWIYLFFMNALWVWVPAILMFDSALKLTGAAKKAKLVADDSVPSGSGSYKFIAATLVLYAVLVPYALATAKPAA